jgi:imidazolonepropionase-like amidohydrolase
LNRREFLIYSALASGASAAGTLTACASLSERMVRPKRLVRPEERLLLKNALIVDVVQGTVMKASNLLIRNGKIEKLATEQEVKTISDAYQLDLGGAYLMPGLINAHCHMTYPGGVGSGFGLLAALERQSERHAEECIKHGVTTVRDMISFYDRTGELKEKINKSEVIGPRIVSSCAMDVEDSYGDQMVFKGEKRYWQEVDNPKRAKDAVKEAFDLGADFIKIFQQPKELVLPGSDLELMNLETIRAVCDEANRVGKTVAMHHSDAAGLNKGLEGGVHSFEHVVRNRLLNDDDIDLMLKSKAVMIPTISSPFALSFESRGDPCWRKGLLPRFVTFRDKIMFKIFEEFCEPELAESSKVLYNEYSDPQSYEEWHLLPWPAPKNFTAGVVIGGENIISLYKAGMPFGCGNDGGIPFVFPGALALEMILLEKLGLATKDIIRMATYNNAKILELDRLIGTIEEGKLADLVVFEENPLESAKNAFYPLMVFKGGQLVFEEAKPGYSQINGS